MKKLFVHLLISFIIFFSGTYFVSAQIQNTIDPWSNNLNKLPFFRTSIVNKYPCDEVFEPSAQRYVGQVMTWQYGCFSKKNTQVDIPSKSQFRALYGNNPFWGALYR